MQVLTGFGLGCLTLLLVMVVRDFNKRSIDRVFLLVLIAGIAFLLDPLVPQPWRWITSDLQTAMPGLFWLLCQLIFARRPNIRSIWGVMALYSFVAPAITRPLLAPAENDTWLYLIGWKMGQLCEYAVVGNALWTLITHWKDDLVEARRRARLFMLLGVGTAVAWTTFSLNTGLFAEYTRGIVGGTAAFITAFFLLRGHHEVLEAESPAIPREALVLPAPPNPANARSVSGLDSIAMPAEENARTTEDETKLEEAVREGIYRTERLTLRQLATLLEIPEYRLRKVINQRLGYRNFNDYINQLRIAEASERLLAEKATPILNISLDVGYRTLSSFNRAFKEITGTTPTEFRQRQP